MCLSDIRTKFMFVGHEDKFMFVGHEYKFMLVGHEDKFVFVGHKDKIYVCQTEDKFMFVGHKDILGSWRRWRRKIYSCVRPREAKLITWSKTNAANRKFFSFPSAPKSTFYRIHKYSPIS